MASVAADDGNGNGSSDGIGLSKVGKQRLRILTLAGVIAGGVPWRDRGQNGIGEHNHWDQWCMKRKLGVTQRTWACGET